MARGRRSRGWFRRARTSPNPKNVARYVVLAALGWKVVERLRRARRLTALEAANEAYAVGPNV